MSGIILPPSIGVWCTGPCPLPLPGFVLVIANAPGSPDGGSLGHGEVWWPSADTTADTPNPGTWECSGDEELVDFIPHGSGSADWGGPWMMLPAPNQEQIQEQIG